MAGVWSIQVLVLLQTSPASGAIVPLGQYTRVAAVYFIEIPAVAELEGGGVGISLIHLGTN